MQKQAETPMRIKMAKVCQLVECCSLAALVLLSGDVSPNPGWNQPILNSPGMKIAHLNVRSLSQHFDEF